MFSFLRKKKTPEHPMDIIRMLCIKMGFELTTNGIGVSTVQLISGYSPAEIASFIIMYTIAEEVKKRRGSSVNAFEICSHVTTVVLPILKQCKDLNLIHPAQWENDTTAFYNISNPSPIQDEWIENVLADEIAVKLKGALAKNLFSFTENE